MFSKIRAHLFSVLWEIDLPEVWEGEGTHVDLGSGLLPRNPFGVSRVIACDIFDSVPNDFPFEYIKCDITGMLPFEDGSISTISAFDVLEHVPRWERQDGEIHFPFVSLMNEIWRSLVPGGILYAVTPMYPSSAAFTDPTHVNYISEGTVHYFAGKSKHASGLGYGFEGDFNILFAGWLRGAGPFDRGESLLDRLRKSNSRRDQSISILKLVRRYLVRVRNRKPMHALWVLQKPHL